MYLDTRRPTLFPTDARRVMDEETIDICFVVKYDLPEFTIIETSMCN